MSLAHDRAQAIAQSLWRDRRDRFVFLMPPAWTLRVVALPRDTDPLLMGWVLAECAEVVGSYGPDVDSQTLEDAIDAAFDRYAPCGTTQELESHNQNQASTA